MKIIKWGVIGIGVVVVLLLAAIFIVPQVVDVQKYKPQIEKMASDATGRSLTLGGEIKLSLFPWVGVSLADVRFGNPPGFSAENMLTVKSFDVRVKLLPLLSKDIQVKRLVLEKPQLFLEKSKNGRGNWEGIGQSGHKEVAPQKKKSPEGSAAGLPIKSLAVGEMAIVNGTVSWQDHSTGIKKEVTDVNLQVRDFSLVTPVHLEFSAIADGQPLSIAGNIGPLGKEPGKGSIPLDFVLKATDQLVVTVKGQVIDLLSKQRFDLSLNLSPFSPRKLFSSLGIDFPLQTADPQILNRLEVQTRVAGTPMDIAISKGVLHMDDSRLTFSAHINELSRPRIQCDLGLDQIDLDRYLPPVVKEPADSKPTPAVSATGKIVGAEKKPAISRGAKKKFDYAPLRRLILDASLQAGKIKAHGAVVQDVVVKISGRKGKFQLNPLSLNLYQGSLHSTGTFNCRQDVPRSCINLQLKDVAVDPLLKDFLKKDILEGTLASQVALSMSGDEAEQIKRSLNGKGSLSLKDGAIIGVDLANLVRNVKSGLGLAEKTAAKPRIDFAELLAPFTIVNGIVDTPGTTMKSPFLRLSVVGKADLPHELLDFRIKPKFVETIRGQGDTKQRSGFMVPLVVSGTFTAPKIRPDLQGMIGKDITAAGELEKMLSDDAATKEKVKSIKKDFKGLLKEFSPGR